MPIEYRLAPLDPAACFNLFASTGWNRLYGLNVDEYSAAVQKSWHHVGAFDGDQLVGLGRIISDGRLYALIVDVIVLPDYQRQSIGTTIMERLLAHCRSAGIRDIKLFAAKGKAEFYNRFGFHARPADSPGMGLLLHPQPPP